MHPVKPLFVQNRLAPIAKASPAAKAPYSEEGTAGEDSLLLQKSSIQFYKGTERAIEAPVVTAGRGVSVCVLSVRVSVPFGSFRKLEVPYFRVLIIRILLFRVLSQGPLFSETPI